MSLSVGIIGLPNVGKSTLFNALLGKQKALVASYPFTTIKPNVGVVGVPDERLEKLKAALYPSPSSASPRPQSLRDSLAGGQPNLVPTTITFVDIAGLVKDAHQGHGLGNEFLSHLRNVDLLLHVLRDFDSKDTPRHEDSKNPEHDAKIVETELELKDLELKERDPEYQDYLAEKPMIYVVNDGRKINRKTICLSAKIEEQISQLPKNEQKEYLKMYGLESSGLDRIINECFHRLELITFFTVTGGKEIRAWSLRRGATALRASSLVHSDFEKYFIRAEVTPWNQLTQAKSWKTAKEKGVVRTEGKDYLVQDGDVCKFLISN